MCFEVSKTSSQVTRRYFCKDIVVIWLIRFNSATLLILNKSLFVSVMQSVKTVHEYICGSIFNFQYVPSDGLVLPLPVWLLLCCPLLK